MPLKPTTIAAFYANHLHPSPQKMRVITQELEVKKQVLKKAGWQLLSPQNYNSARRKPEQTEQSKLVLEAYSRALLKELQERKRIILTHLD